MSNRLDFNAITPLEQRIVENCHRSLSFLDVILRRTQGLPDHAWDPGYRVLCVADLVPLYILVHEIAHVWVAHASNCLMYPEFGLGYNRSFVSTSAPAPFMIEDRDVRDTMEDAAAVLGLLLLTRWSGEPYLAFNAHLREGRAMLTRRGARKCLDLGLIRVDQEGRLLLQPEDGPTQSYHAYASGPMQPSKLRDRW